MKLGGTRRGSGAVPRAQRRRIRFESLETRAMMDANAPFATGVFLPGDLHPVLSGDRLVSAPQQLTLSFSEAMSEVDGASGAGSVLNPANYHVTLFGADYSANIAEVVYAFNAVTNRHEATLHFAAPLPGGVYAFSALATLQDVEGNGLDGDLDGIAGGDHTIDFEIARILPDGVETPVNTTTSGDQTFTIGAPGTIASDNAGNYVITWAGHSQDGDGWGIFAQRFTAGGEKVGGEFQVNTYTTSHQRFSTVAMDPDGDFVITWSSNGQDGGNYGVYAQRYDAAGNPVGVEFRVNTRTNKFQGRSTVAMDDDGDFVIAWESVDQDSSSVGIYFQRYAADGSTVGVETRANTITAGPQRLPNVAMDADGDFVITWSGPTDGSGYGIFARRFTADGVGQGPEFLANTLTAGNQQDSTVAMDADGDFVVAWQSSTGDGVLYGVYAQRFTAQGEKFGSQFLVNSYTANFQQFPSVAIDTNGDFAITWQSLTQDASVWGVYGQRYSWGGGRVGGEFQIHTTTAESQTAPNVAMTPRGDFVVAWQSMSQDGSGWGIYTQRYVGQINQTPVAAAGGPYAIAEGGELQLDGSASTDTDFGQVLSYAWDLNHDGVFEDAVGASPLLAAVELAALGIADDGVYPIAVRVDDGYGGTHIAESSLTTENVAPSGLVLDPVDAIDEGSNVMLSGVFVDPGSADAHTLDIDWGDGTIESVPVLAGSRDFQVAHTYRDDGPSGTSFDPATIRVTVRDDDGGASDPAEVMAEIHNVAPMLVDLQFSKIVLDEGESFIITGRVNDPGADDTHTLLFVWADGVEQLVEIDPITRTFEVSHTFADDAPSETDVDLTHFTFTVADDDLGEEFTPAAVTVRNVAPSFAEVLLSTNAIVEGDGVTVSGVIVDPGLSDVFTLSIDWGDGQNESVTVDPVTRAFSATHTYTDDNPTDTAADDYAIKVAVSDDDLGYAETGLTINVANQAPSAEIVVTPLEPTPMHDLVFSATVTDPGADTFIYAWELLRNGNVVAISEEAELHFTPQQMGDYQVVLHVTDDDGGTTTVERTISIRFRPGDTNGDDRVDIEDLNNVRNYFGVSRGDEEWQSYVGPLPGDANGDDVVNIEDLNLVRNHFGEGSAPSIASQAATAAAPRAASDRVAANTRATDAVFAQLAMVNVAPTRRLGRSR
jgi:hypothetical protein